MRKPNTLIGTSYIYKTQTNTATQVQQSASAGPLSCCTNSAIASLVFAQVELVALQGLKAFGLKTQKKGEESNVLFRHVFVVSFCALFTRGVSEAVPIRYRSDISQKNTTKNNKYWIVSDFL